MRTSLPIKRLLAFSCVALLLAAVFPASVSSSNRFRTDPDIVGKIVDFDTKAPIAGVVVMAVWTTDVFRLVIEPKTEYYDYFETLTDQNGEFRIPGKGLILLSNVNPPKVKIFKSGYAFMYLDDLGVHFRRDSRFGDQVKWVDGKPIISFKKKSPEERKKAVKKEGKIPFHEMAIPGLPEEKYRLYQEEVTQAFHALGMTPYWEQDHRYIQIKKGGVYPAQEMAVDPVKGD
jgi:hypothetical protein